MDLIMTVGRAPVLRNDVHEEDEDLEAAGRRPDGYQPLAPGVVRITYYHSGQPYLLTTVFRMLRLTMHGV